MLHPLLPLFTLHHLFGLISAVYVTCLRLCLTFISILIFLSILFWRRCKWDWLWLGEYIEVLKNNVAEEVVVISLFIVIWLFLCISLSLIITRYASSPRWKKEKRKIKNMYLVFFSYHSPLLHYKLFLNIIRNKLILHLIDDDHARMFWFFFFGW